MNTAVVYTRVSKRDGSQHVENQVPDIEALAAARGLTITAKFSDSQSAVRRRPGLEAMLKALRSGKFGPSPCLVIWSLDRLGRGLGCFDLYRELIRLNVRVLSCREPWLDQEGPTRELLAILMSWVSGFERSRLIERTKAGLERARRKGKKLGRPRANVDAAKVVALRSQGFSLQQIGERLGVSHTTIRRTLLSVSPPNEMGIEKADLQPCEIPSAA